MKTFCRLSQKKKKIVLAAFFPSQWVWVQQIRPRFELLATSGRSFTSCVILGSVIAPYQLIYAFSDINKPRAPAPDTKNSAELHQEKERLSFKEQTVVRPGRKYRIEVAVRLTWVLKRCASRNAHNSAFRKFPRWLRTPPTNPFVLNSSKISGNKRQQIFSGVKKRYSLSPPWSPVI